MFLCQHTIKICISNKLLHMKMANYLVKYLPNENIQPFSQHCKPLTHHKWHISVTIRNPDQNIGDSIMSVIFRIYIGRNVFQVVTGLALFTHWLTKFIHSSGWKYLQTGLKSTNLNAKDSIIQNLDIWIWATKQFINFKFTLQIFLDVFDNTFK